MIVTFAKIVSMVARAGTGAAEATTEAQAVGDNNYAEVTLYLHEIFAVGGSAPELVAQAEGSNDGINYYAIGGIAVTGSARQTLYPAADYVTAPYVRFKFTLSLTGTGDNWAGATFDLHVNLTTK